MFEDSYIELIECARNGDQDSLKRLTDLARERLRVYVFRLTMREDLTQDIVQESLLEMFKTLGKLRQADRFWPWLYGVAMSKIHRHNKAEQRQREISVMESGGGRGVEKQREDGLEKLVSQELGLAVREAMGRLRPKYRAVLAMRCYDEMSYNEIAEAMGRSEFSTRVLFVRAKKSLQKELSCFGLGKGAMLTALVLFGKMTAPSEAAAAQISITAATTNAGLAASAAGLVCSKATIVTVAAAGAIAVGSVVATPEADKMVVGGGQKTEACLEVKMPVKAVGAEESWYYFPKGAGGPVMMRVMGFEDGKGIFCKTRQDEGGNYEFDKCRNAVHITNHRMWREDGRVQRLPTDGPQLSEFISKVEGREGEMEYVRGGGEGLLVIAKQGKEGGEYCQKAQHYNVLDEEYFRYNLPMGVRNVDKRDAMHQRGWTYFTVEGQIGEEKISGNGRIAFVYAASEIQKPWLNLRVGNRLRIVDCCDGAGIYEVSGKAIRNYAAGSFFEGLGRPWMGLHTIDTVRRDAAEKGIWFETKFIGEKAEVVLSSGRVKIEYVIDMERDVIEEITFLKNEGQSWVAAGELRFEYMEDIGGIGNGFVEPRSVSSDAPQRGGNDSLWLVQLADGELVGK